MLWECVRLVQQSPNCTCEWAIAGQGLLFTMGSRNPILANFLVPMKIGGGGHFSLAVPALESTQSYQQT